MARELKISEAEWDVMEPIWAVGACTAAYIYRAAVSRRRCVRQEGRSFLEKAFGGDVAALVAHFVTESPLDPKQIEELRHLLQMKREPKEKRK
jgi:BlaI family penicillinase repressor